MSNDPLTHPSVKTWVFAFSFGFLIGAGFVAMQTPDRNVRDCDCDAAEESMVETTVSPSSTVPDRQVEWLARALYSEAKDMELHEYNAWVIRNRLEDNQYPGTVKEVVLQDKQFSAFNDWQRRQELRAMSYETTEDSHYRRAYRMAKYVLHARSEANPLPEVTHFYMQDVMKEKFGKPAPDWADQGHLRYQYGDTKYYTDVPPPNQHTTSHAR